MFSLLKKLASWALDGFAGHKVKEKLEDDFPIAPKRSKKVFQGKVTNINLPEEYGIVDRAVYFNFSVVYSGKELVVGNSVLVHATQKETLHAWIATYVEYIPQQKKKTTTQDTSGHMKETNSNQSRKFENKSHLVMDHTEKTMDRIDTIEQTVSECNGMNGKLKDGFEFLVEHGETEFVPVIGDVLLATVHYTNSDRRVVSWRPKEVKCIEGLITASENDCGIIDTEVIFFRNSCRRKVAVYVGQKVSAMVASSEQGLFKWRAFSLCTMMDDEANSDTPKPHLINVEGISVTEPLSFEDILLGKENELQVTLQNSNSTQLVFLSCHFQNSNGIFYIGKNATPLQRVPENGVLNLTIHCKTETIGQHKDFLLFEFSDFIIKRSVTVTIVDPMQHILKPVAPFRRLNKNNQSQLDNEDLVIIPGKKPFKPVSQFSNKLPPCPIPRPLMRSVQNREDLKYAVPWMFKNLTMNNYVKKFSTLLHLEEIQVRFDMKKFDLSEALLQRKGEFLSLEVEGLSEGRPSLIIGDKAIIVPPYQRSSFGFEGYIHEVRLNEVLLKFNDTFHSSYGGECFDVRFELNRTNFRRLHQCVHHVSENHEYAIFPSRIVLRDPLVNLGLVEQNFKHKHKRHKPQPVRTVTWKNTQLNWKQKEAVLRIVECRCRPLPYIIFGPPGTGKTITLVEAVLQVYETIPTSRIIICTPSNSAADLVAQRIISSELVTTTDMVRLNSYQRSVESIPEFVKPYCQDKDSIDYVTQYRIIISTCSTAGSLYNIGLCNDYFTHVFIDEAGQLMEPESDIALGFIDFKTDGQLVMAGDPQQLGPVLRSSLALTHGLQVSYLERLMSTPLYGRNEKEFSQHGGYNPLLVTMLEESYRSHPDILAFPSDIFYFSQIICRFPVRELTDWGELLPHPGFPVVFHGVKGEEMREQNSPSWFNPSEVVQVIMYLQKLYNLGLASSQVGIIAPYKKQVEKIRLMLSTLQLESCKLGSVEEFQGQERKAIIISTVRSSDQYVNCDILYNLGFISNPKRLNVAITRSQELLIVVGNPYILSKDFYWHSFVRYCVVNGCYTGCELPLSFTQSKPDNAAA